MSKKGTSKKATSPKTWPTGPASCPKPLIVGRIGINIALYIRDFRKGPQQIYWAYLEVKNGKITLPEVAEQASGSKTFKIPAKYKAELEKVLKTL